MPSRKDRERFTCDPITLARSEGLVMKAKHEEAP